MSNTIYLFIIWLNAIICAIAALRLLTFSPENKTHKPWANVLAYLTAVAFASTSILIMTGNFPKAACIPQTFLNVVFCAAIFAGKGNILFIFGKGKRNPKVKNNLALQFLDKKTWV